MSQNEPKHPETAADTSLKSRIKLRTPRRTVIRLVVLAACILLVAAGVPYFMYASSHESTDNAFIEGHVINISPRIDGHVSQVLVEDNQYVKTGAPLVAIDPSDYQAALDAAQANERAADADVTEAEAQAAAAQSHLEQARADLDSQRAALAQAQADVAQAEAEHTRDAADLKRTRSMAKTGAVSPQQFDHAVASEAMSGAKLRSTMRQVDTQSARIAQAEAAIKAAGDTLRQTQAQTEARKADLQKAAAESEQARLNLSYTRIAAPCDGYVTKKSVEPGAYVQVGQGLLAVVRPDVWVVANFKETQLTDMRPGQPVDIEIDTYPGVTFHGRVDSIQRGTGSRFSLLPPENATGNFVKVVQRVPVKIVFDNDESTGEHLLTPGMSTIPEVDISAPGRDPMRAEAAPNHQNNAVRVQADAQ